MRVNSKTLLFSLCVFYMYIHTYTYMHIWIYDNIIYLREIEDYTHVHISKRVLARDKYHIIYNCFVFLQRTSLISSHATRSSQWITQLCYVVIHIYTSLSYVQECSILCIAQLFYASAWDCKFSRKKKRYKKYVAVLLFYYFLSLFPR